MPRRVLTYAQAEQEGLCLRPGPPDPDDWDIRPLCILDRGHPSTHLYRGENNPTDRTVTFQVNGG